MSARRLARFGVALFAIACVDIATGPGGTVSIRVDPVPRAIILGDTLRDSSGAAIRLHAIGYGTSGDTLGGLAFRFLGLPIGRDTLEQKPVALIVDSVTGLVRAPSTWIDDAGRVAISLGGRLQVVDTFVIVPKPSTLARPLNPGETVLRPDTSSVWFDCTDSGRVLAGPVAIPSGARAYAGRLVGNAVTLASRVLSGDSAVGKSIPVRGYLVQYTIDSVAGKAAPSIPTVQFPGQRARPAIGFAARSSDATIQFDTTDASGITAPRLRIFPIALGRSTAFPDSTIRVVVRAVARTSRTATVADTSRSVVVLHRQTVSFLSASPLSCAQ